ncbi:MAG: hypothetical protein AAGJ81_11055 [Verrucomicrobiota bacterium]
MTRAWVFLCLLAHANGLLIAQITPRVTSRAPEQGNVTDETEYAILRGSSYNFLDSAKNYVYLFFNENLQIIDSELSDGEEIQDNTFANRMRFSPYAIYQPNSSSKFSLDLDYSASIRLPRLEKRLRLIIDTGDIAPLPATQPDEEENEPLVGLQRNIRRYGSARLGVKLGLPVVGYAIASWQRNYRADAWHIRPSGDVFYQTDDEGFGTGTNLLFGRWWGRFTGKSSSGIRITEATEGFEWASAIDFMHAARLIEPSDDPPLISSSALNRGLALTYRISGHISGSKTIDEHRVSLTYRYPLRKNWMFLVISPEIRWERDNDWGPDERIRVGIDMLFWGITR